MRFIDLTLDQPAENLALDEALLEEAESAEQPQETLRLWESPSHVAVVGRSSSVGEEIDLAQCARRGIPVLRRCSGGASVLIGPGCLMYSLVLSYELRPALRIVEQAHRFVLERIACALQPGWPEEIRRQGISDLTRGDRKFSGNSLRCKRTHLLYHGTLLYQFPLALLGEVLRTPPRQPEYRHGRSHAQFVDNLPLEVSRLRDLLVEAWQPATGPSDWPRDLTETLVRERYEREEWNLRR